MSQALPVLSSPPPLPVAGGAPLAAETADSGHSFEAALASQRETGELPASPEPGPSGGAAGAGNTGSGVASPAPGPAAVAAGGKDLPPELPPDAAALALSLIRPESLNPAATPEVPVVGPEAGEPLPAAGEAAADAAVAALAAIPLPMPAANGEPAAPVLDAVQGSVVAAASAARVAQPLPAAGPATAATQSATEPFAAIPSTVDADASGRDAAERLTSLKAVTDAAPELAGVENRAGPSSTTSFNTLVNLAGPAASAPAAPAASAQVNVPLGHAAWGQTFGNQVVWAVNQGLPSAALHLSPADLGPVSIQIRLDNDQASIQFVSAHAVVRDAIESALPRLREMLGTQGIVLADVNVSQHGQSGHAQRDPAAGLPSAGRGAGMSAEHEPLAAMAARSLGVLDVYV